MLESSEMCAVTYSFKQGFLQILSANLMHGKQTVNCKDHFLHQKKKKKVGGMFYKQRVGQ